MYISQCIANMYFSECLRPLHVTDSDTDFMCLQSDIFHMIEVLFPCTYNLHAWALFVMPKKHLEMRTLV